MRVHTTHLEIPINIGGTRDFVRCEVIFFPKHLVVTNKSLISLKTISMAIDKVTYWKELADYDIDTAE